MDIETTYRVIDLSNRENVGLTAATADLAKLAAGSLYRDTNTRFGLEQTEWDEEYGRPKARRSIIVEAEDPANPWKIGN